MKTDTLDQPAVAGQSPGQDTHGALPAVPRRGLPKLWTLAAIGAFLAMVFHFGLAYLVRAFTHESTDDAFLEAHVVAVAPRVAGQVQVVRAKDNQLVQQGDLLVEIDPQDYAMKVAQKQASAQTSEANLKTIISAFELLRAKVKTAEATARQSKAEVEADAAAAERARAAFKRSQELRQQGTISPQEFDDAQAAAKQAEANLNSTGQKAAADESKVEEARAQLGVAETAVDLARAQLKQAQTDVGAASLDLSYARIVAPWDGRVTRKSVEPGAYVQVGQSLLAIVPTSVWVVANFKETQLTDMRPGQAAEIHLDAYPGKMLRGHVESIMAGSGARFSLLPPENAVGNFVKVVQRVPVKIVFNEPPDPAMALGPGMSVVPEVRISVFTVSAVLLWTGAVVLAALATLGLARVIAHRRD